MAALKKKKSAMNIKIILFTGLFFFGCYSADKNFEKKSTEPKVKMVPNEDDQKKYAKKASQRVLNISSRIDRLKEKIKVTPLSSQLKS